MAFTNTSNESDANDVILRELTVEMLQVSIPVLCFISLMMLIGTMGNTLVILTYFKRVDKSSTNLFIFCLAVFDIINCALTLPMEMNDLTHPYTNDLNVLCKIHKFTGFTADLCSGFIIVCISFDRYLRIARPHQGLSVKGSKIAICVILLLAILISVLSLVIYGKRRITFPEHPGIVGVSCGVQNEMRLTAMPIIFNILILTTFCIGVAILLVVYTMLGLKVKRWNQDRKLKISGNRCSDYCQQTAISDETDSPNSPDVRQSETFTFLPTTLEKSSDDNVKEDEEPSFKRPTFVRELSRSLDRNSFLKLDTGLHMNGTQTLPHRKSSAAKRKQCPSFTRKTSIPKLIDFRRRIKISKTTVMFISATIAFVASHIPYACIKVAFTVNPGLTDSMTSLGHSFFLFAEYSFIVSYAVNPIIYSFLNPKYRRECRTFLRDLSNSLKCHSKQFFIR